MSDPVTNVQIEDVLSSIRRLVSEEIGQSGIQPLEPRRRQVEEPRLVLTPTQKIHRETTKASDDLWNETASLTPKASEPVWWSRISGEDSDESKIVEDEPTVETKQESGFDEDMSDAENETLQTSDDMAVDETDESTKAPMFISRLGGAIADLEAAMPQDDDEWEPAEGETFKSDLDIDAMPWAGDIEMDDIEGDEIAEVSRGRRLPDHDDDVFARLLSDDAPIEEDLSEPVSEDISFLDAEQVELDEVRDELAETSFLEDRDSLVDPVDEADEYDDIPFSFRPGERLFERLSGAAPRPSEREASVFARDVQTKQDIEQYTDSGFELDEDMLREMVRDIVRQELQGALGERITRNVRKLVRREIQRAFSSLSQ